MHYKLPKPLKYDSTYYNSRSTKESLLKRYAACTRLDLAMNALMVRARPLHCNSTYGNPIVLICKLLCTSEESEDTRQSQGEGFPEIRGQDEVYACEEAAQKEEPQLDRAGLTPRVCSRQPGTCGNRGPQSACIDLRCYD